MKRNIILNGRAVEYELERKKVKNLNLRVGADGVHVSADRRVPVYAVEDFMRRSSAFILRAIGRAESRQQLSPGKLDLAPGGAVPYMGEALPLTVRAGTKNRAESDGRSIVLTLKDPQDAELCRRVVEKWLRERCIETVTACCEAVYPYFAARGVKYPELRFRRMTSRWGSCQCAKGVLTFNTALICVPRECMEYVVVHEFAHFLRPDHSAYFYAEVERLIPDWKARRRALGAYAL